jgi:hypothetical protein
VQFRLVMFVLACSMIFTTHVDTHYQNIWETGV